MDVLCTVHRLRLEHFILKSNFIFPFWDFFWMGYRKMSRWYYSAIGFIKQLPWYLVVSANGDRLYDW